MADTGIMDTLPLFACFLLTVLSSESVVFAAEPELTLHPGGNLRQGDTLTITCETTNFEMFDFIRISRVGEGQMGRTGEIVTNNVLDDDHKDSGRYILEESIMDTDTGVGKIKLRINNIQGKDGGKIECAHRPKMQIASEEISIAVPPKEVKLMYLNEDGEKVEVENGGVLKMKYGQESGMYCHVEVEGKTTAPKIDLLMDNKNAKKTFKTNHYTDTGVAQTGFLNDKYVADMEYVSNKPNVDFDGKKLKCKAKLGDFPPLETAAQIEVLYAPQMKCDARTFVKLGAKEAKIECAVKMNPAPNLSSWSFGKLPNRTVLQMGESSEEYSATMEKVNRNDYKFSLLINEEITQDHLQSFELAVGNDVGRVDKSIGLHEEGGAVWEEAQASASRGSALCMFFNTVSIVALAATILMT